jgi:chemotaxis protein CheY-P-specific phosphatase CheC
VPFNRKINKIGEMEESALLEIGNILSGAIVGPIANFIGKKIILEQPRLNISYHPGAIGYALEEQMQAINSCLFPSVKIRVETKAEETFLISLFFPFFDMVGYIWRKLTAKILEECKNKKIL